MDWWALGISIALCVGAGAAEAMIGGSDLPRWLTSLRRPRLFAPLWVWVTIAVATYILQGAIAFRLLAMGPTALGSISLILLISVMAANIAYNAALDRLRSPRFAYTGILLFLPPLVALQIVLAFTDSFAAGLNMIYLLWVAGYDLPIMRAVWKLNSPKP